MATTKRTADGNPKIPDTNSSPIMQAFGYFRSELDEHHDRRERVIKASRDITAQSKKIIFSLQRVRTLGKPIPAGIRKDIDPRKAEISKLFESVQLDLQGMNAWRYQKQVTSGIQEFMEAILFEHYLMTQTLLTLDESRGRLPEGMGLLLQESDYVLGLYDTTGEIMRFAITGMATGGSVPAGEGEAGRNVLTDLRELRNAMEGLDLRGSWLGRESDKKAEVMRASVDKVENAVYGLIVRGRERPKGWMPDAGGSGGPPKAEVESY